MLLPFLELAFTFVLALLPHPFVPDLLVPRPELPEALASVVDPLPNVEGPIRPDESPIAMHLALAPLAFVPHHLELLFHNILLLSRNGNREL